MIQAVCSVTLNKITELCGPNAGYDSFSGLRLYNSIETGLPFGCFYFSDKSGRTFAEFENLQIGAIIDLALISIDDENNKFEYPEMNILWIENDFELSASQMSGVIKIWFGHPWLIYKNTKNHCYKAASTTELIKKIVLDEDRGKKFEIDDSLFEVTDQNGGYSKFKVCETDWDFIQNKLIPFTAIEEQPAHFYCDENGKFHLSSYKKLYKSTPKLLFHGQEGSITENSDVEKMNSIITESGIPNSAHMVIQTASLKIGSDEINTDIFPSFFFENLASGTFINGSKRAANMLSQRNGSNFGDLLPLDQLMMLNIKGTSTKVIRNRQAVEALTFLFETAKRMDGMFKLLIESNFNGNFLTVGDTVYIYLPSIKIEGAEKLKEHWLNGKWLVTSVEHYSEHNAPKTLKSKIQLERPSFIGDDNNTSLIATPMLYGVIH